MKIRYKNILNKFVSFEELKADEWHTKQYIEVDKIRKEEVFYHKGDRVAQLIIYRDSNESHQDILDTKKPDNELITIRETEKIGNYRLEKDFEYDKNAKLYLYFNALYDPEDNQVACQFLDINGVPNYKETEKYYFAPSAVALIDDYIFSCEYNEDGSLREIYYCDSPEEQDSMLFHDSPEDIEHLMLREGISQELMDYYLSPDVTPKGLLR